MSLFDPPIRAVLTPTEAELFERTINGDAGSQILLRKLHGDYDPASRTLMVEDTSLIKALEYAYSYGPGGYQGRFRAVIAAATRAGWEAPARPDRPRKHSRRWNAPKVK